MPWMQQMCWQWYPYLAKLKGVEPFGAHSEKPVVTRLPLVHRQGVMNGPLPIKVSAQEGYAGAWDRALVGSCFDTRPRLASQRQLPSRTRSHS